MNGGGTVTTAGNLVFGASGTGDFVAFSADKGEKLWSAKLLPGIANPVTYMSGWKAIRFSSFRPRRKSEDLYVRAGCNTCRPQDGPPASPTIRSDRRLRPPVHPRAAPNAPTAPTTANPNGTDETH